jgi:hypothetical protein
VRFVVVVLVAGFLGGCSMPGPKYAEVRSETLAALQSVADLMPEPKDIVPTPEFRPYSCDDELLLSQGSGAFFTGQWALFVSEDFDIPGFINGAPQLLGAGWRVEELGVPVNFAEVYLVRDSPRMTMTIEEATIDGRKAIELLAISRCGSITDGERGATWPPPTPQPTS